MRKIILVLITFLMTVSLSGCLRQTSQVSPEKKKLSVVTTIFPIYDWVKNIAGEETVEIEMLMDSGVDLHSFQPSADDIMKIRNCDLFIYIGGESDEWIEDVLDEGFSQEIRTVNLLELLKDLVKEEEIVEGMQKEEDDDKEADEHIWLSLNNAIAAVEKITEALEEIDVQHQEVYQTNAEAYIQELKDLDQKYVETVSASALNTLLFADRFPFRYLCDDYYLNYYAAFAGCSAETEASFETIVFLADKIDELSLRNIMIIESSDGRIAETIKENTKTKDQQILRLDSMQSITSAQVENISYLQIMETNLEVLKEALKGE